MTRLQSGECRSSNIDPETVKSFGEEWSAYDQTELQGGEYEYLFERYFAIFPFNLLPPEAEGFDLGCGSGRWAAGVAPRVGILHCIDPSAGAISVARSNLRGHDRIRFHQAAADTIPLPDRSQDFGYSLGVLHHVPDTARALTDCVRKLKPGAPFLVYLYYRFDQRPIWFRALWKGSDLLRKRIARLPFSVRRRITDAIALTVYWPLSRGASVAEKAGLDVGSIPLSAYRNSSWYTLRTDALDRFGTRLEHRFTRPEIATMMRNAGLTDIKFSETEPYWVACGIKS